MRARYRPFGALTVVVSGSLLLGIGLATPVYAEDYPTWDEVEQARQNEAATRAEVGNIEKLLVGLELQTANLVRDAQLKGELYNAARAELDRATDRADKLDTQAKDAAHRAEVSARRAGQLLAYAARTGGGDVSLALLMSPDADDLLSTLGTMGRLSEQSALIAKQALADRNSAQSLTDQAEVAEEKREQLALGAEAALAAAQAASTGAQRELAQQQAAAEQLYAQLASLKGTTAEIERQYLAGLANQPPAPNPGTPGGPPTPPPTNPPTTPPPTAPPVTQPPPPPPPTPGAAQGAISFARAQVGDPYVYGGSGPNGWDCSGLTKAAYASVGIYIGIHGATSQYNYLGNQGKLVSVNALQPGDLVFYSDDGTTWGLKYHTAIYIGGGMMIEAPYEPYSVWVTPLRWHDLVPYAGRPAG